MYKILRINWQMDLFIIQIEVLFYLTNGQSSVEW